MQDKNNNDPNLEIFDSFERNLTLFEKLCRKYFNDDKYPEKKFYKQ